MRLKDEITIRTGEQGYPVIFDNHKRYLQKVVGNKTHIIIVSNPIVYALHGRSFIRQMLPKRSLVTPVMIGDGERYKAQTTVNQLYGQFLDIGVGRNDVVVAFGGGVVGDTAGYAAATYMRGIRLIQAPTTLLAMVDSSVGGKVGINHRQGKNLIGAFYQPQAVVIDPRWLTTLSQRDLISGMGEIIKTAFISSPGFLQQIHEITPDSILSDTTRIQKLVQLSLQVKGEAVRLDVHDQGVRAILNFGHTFAHAIEKVDGYGQYRHGEAVLAGMAGALFLSRRSGYLAQSALNEYLATLAPFVATIKPLNGSARDYLLAMSVDKKVRNRCKVFVLLQAAGKPVVRKVASDSMILGAIDQMLEFINSRRRR
jgi:3-dehydroquinate synthase